MDGYDEHALYKCMELQRIKNIIRAEDLLLWFRPLVAFAEAQGLVTSTLMVAHSHS